MEKAGEADKYFFIQIEKELVKDETLSQQARNNTINDFKKDGKQMGTAPNYTRLTRVTIIPAAPIGRKRMGRG